MKDTSKRAQVATWPPITPPPADLWIAVSERGMRVPLQGGTRLNLNIPPRCTINEMHPQGGPTDTSGRVGRVLHVRSWPRSAGPHTRTAEAEEGAGSPTIRRSTDFSARFTVSVTLSVTKACRYTIVAWVARLTKVVLKFTPHREGTRGLPSFPTIYTFPPSPSAVIMHVILRLLMIALDRVRDLTRCEYNTRVFICPYICGSILLS